MEGGGFSRLDHWHGEAALKRVHASVHNYPLRIETTTIIKDAERGLIRTSKNGSWSVTEHAWRGPCTRMLASMAPSDQHLHSGGEIEDK